MTIKGIDIESVVGNTYEFGDIVILDKIDTLHDLMTQDLERYRMWEAFKKNFDNLTHHQGVASRPELRDARTPSGDEFLNTGTTRESTKFRIKC